MYPVEQPLPAPGSGRRPLHRDRLHLGEQRPRLRPRTGRAGSPPSWTAKLCVQRRGRLRYRRRPAPPTATWPPAAVRYLVARKRCTPAQAVLRRGGPRKRPVGGPCIFSRATRYRTAAGEPGGCRGAGRPYTEPSARCTQRLGGSRTAGIPFDRFWPQPCGLFPRWSRSRWEWPPT